VQEKERGKGNEGKGRKGWAKHRPHNKYLLTAFHVNRVFQQHLDRQLATHSKVSCQWVHHIFLLFCVRCYI